MHDREPPRSPSPRVLPELLTRRDRHPTWLTRAGQQGRLVPVLPGVYLRPDVASDPVWRARAATAWRPDAVIAGDLAARLTFWRDREVGPVDVITRTDCRRTGYRFHERRVPPGLVTRYGFLRITLPALTALDLSLTAGPDALDHALRSRLVRIEDLQAALAATPRRRGNRDRRRLLLDSRAEPWSAAERLAHRVLRAAGETGWRANVRVVVDGWQYFIDIAFEDDRLAVEIDGRAYHGGDDVFEDDRERQNDLVMQGWTVLRFTWRMLRERPDYVVAAIRRGRRLARRPQRIRGSMQDPGPDTPIVGIE